MPPEPIGDFVISAHARAEMDRRGITGNIVWKVVTAAEQRFQVSDSRIILHSRIMMGSPRTMYLVRVILDIDRHPPEVVTVYRTTKVAKYWRAEP